MIQHKIILSLVMGLFLLLTLLSGGCDRHATTREITNRAKNGVLDLSGWDFEKSGKVDLNGEWEFYWRQLIHPIDFSRDAVESPPSYFSAPGLWNTYQLNGQPIGKHGYATFRLTVMVPEVSGLFAIKILDMGTAYKLWANGQPLLSNGLVGTSKEGSAPFYLPGTAVLPYCETSIELVLQVSNFDHRKGGLWKPIEFGLSHQIARKREMNIAFELFVCGSLFIIGIYHLGYFVIRRNDRSSGYFGIACLLTAFRGVLTGERYLVYLFSNMNWEFIVKLEYISFYLAVPMFLLFLDNLYREFNHKIAKGMLYIGAVFSLLTLVTPVNVYSYAMPYNQLIVVGVCLYAVFCLVRAVVKKQKGARWVSFGVIVLVTTVFHDLLLNNEFIYSIPLGSFGLFVFIFIQSVMLSLRFSKAYSTLEVMSEQLSEYADQMEELVEKRTDELAASNQKLQLTNRKMSDSVNYASIIQKSLLPSLRKIKQYLPDSFFIWRPRDIVGGDYFSLEPVKNGFMMAMIDCTGHGIPGALMTMIASSGLRRIIVEEKCDDPATILKRLNYLVKTTLQQDKSYAKSDNGLDGAICYVNEFDSEIVFAGARLPFVTMIEGEISFIKGDRQSVGYKNSDLNYDYTNHVIPIDSRATYYMYTDGITDQVIENENFAIGQRRFYQFLCRNHQYDFDRQKEIILEQFLYQQGADDTRDDITMIGFKFGDQ